jgi:hypothetical protein
MTVHKYYIPAEGPKVNNIKVELYYSLGGMNYFTGRAEDRGYYLSVTPVFKEDRGGCIMESMTAFTGTKMLLLPVARKSTKAGTQAFGLMKEKADTLIDFVCKEQGIKLLKEC